MVLPSAPLTAELTEFDEMLVAKSIATREQCLRCKGFSDEQIAEILEGEAERLAAEVNAEAEAELKPPPKDGDDDSYEDSGADDDAAVRSYREARMAQLKAAQARQAGGAGGLVEVGRAAWEEEVVAASADRWVVVHLHAEGSLEPQTGRGVPAQCAAVGAALRELAARFAEPKWCVIPALEAVPPSELAKLPALFCYRGGALRHSLMGPRAFGEAPSAAQLADALAEVGVLEGGASEHALRRADAVSDHESDDLSD